MSVVRARSALFDVYGSHLRDHGGAATIAALVRLLEPLGFSAPAVRTAVSRMAAQNWLRAVRLPDGPGYRLTARGRQRLDEAGARIYRTKESTWDGRWHLVNLARATGRELSSQLRLLGYGPIGGSTWIAPRPSPGLAEVLDAADMPARTFHAEHEGDDAELAARAWDLDELGTRYAEFVDQWEPEVSAVPDTEPAAAFAASQRLLHEWRGFLFLDPVLPAELLPAGWQGKRAVEFFDEQTARLAPAAAKFVEACLHPNIP